MLVELIHGFLLNFHCADPFSLDAFGTFQDVLDANFVGGEGSASCPVASDTYAKVSSSCRVLFFVSGRITIYYKVVGKFRHSGCEVYLGFVLELVGHSDPIDTFHFTVLELILHMPLFSQY